MLNISMGCMEMAGGMMDMGWIGMLLNIVMLAGLIALAVWAVQRTTSSRSTAEPPLAILQRRYAQGEINGAEYEQIRSRLAQE